jgi:hypothetical protein
MQNASTINNQLVSTQNSIDWLKNREQNFRESNTEEHLAILNFTLVWSYFEAKQLGANASAKAIQTWVDGIVDFDFSKFETNFDYFRGRYFVNDKFTEHFDGLKFRENDKKRLVKEIMCANTKNSKDSITALLIVVYRIRNNLFHGTKWANGINEQIENFKHATQALMAACETS